MASEWLEGAERDKKWMRRRRIVFHSRSSWNNFISLEYIYRTIRSYCRYIPYICTHCIDFARLLLFFFFCYFLFFTLHNSFRFFEFLTFFSVRFCSFFFFFFTFANCSSKFLSNGGGFLLLLPSFLHFFDIIFELCMSVFGIVKNTQLDSNWFLYRTAHIFWLLSI